jgi:hypothetical protein
VFLYNVRVCVRRWLWVRPCRRSRVMYIERVFPSSSMTRKRWCWSAKNPSDDAIRFHLKRLFSDVEW